jgi:hypothetical protein
VVVINDHGPITAFRVTPLAGASGAGAAAGSTKTSSD